MAALAELDASLEALRALKAPGVTKSRISSITTLCLENVKSESVLVQKIYTNFKKSPPTHKLGVMYVVDSVARQWIEKAGVNGQDVSKIDAPDGTFAAGVRRVTELLPTLMNDLVQSAPDDQKDKILKLIDIWERGSIFPLNLLSEYKTRLNNRPPKPSTSSNIKDDSTPFTTAEPGSSARHMQPANPLQFSQISQPAVTVAPTPTLPVQNASSILASLAMAQTQAPIAAAPMPIPAPMNIPQIPIQAPTHAPLGLSAEQAGALASVIPAHVANDPEALAQHLKILQQLAEMGVPADQWPLVLQALQGQQPSVSQQVPTPASGSTGMHQRGRSRSPNGRRNSPVYGQSYRQRSPLRAASPTLQADTISLTHGMQPKWTDYDGTLAPGHIKVLSRTLFVGGVACTESELRQIFTRFGRVQTCIANTDKRHAFVKMCTRAEALAARDGMQNIRDGDVFAKIRSVRWGVGFGPRDCSDYSTGVSVIPIERLTDADRKWVLTAEWGGTGGKELIGGMVMEEPDIEIGAGVSSKAISARRTGANGPEPQSNSNSHNRRSGGSNGRDKDRSHDRAAENSPRNGHNRGRSDHRNDSSAGGMGSGDRGRNGAGRDSMSMGGIPGYAPGSAAPAMNTYGAPPAGLGVSPAVPGFGFNIPGMLGAPPGMGMGMGMGMGGFGRGT